MVYRYAVPCQDWCLQTIPIEGEQPPKCNPSDSSWGTVFAQALRSGLVVKASGCLKSRCTIPCPSQFRDTKLRAQGENFLACRHCYDPDLQSALGHVRIDVHGLCCHPLIQHDKTNQNLSTVMFKFDFQRVARFELQVNTCFKPNPKHP